MIYCPENDDELGDRKILVYEFFLISFIINFQAFIYSGLNIYESRILYCLRYTFFFYGMAGRSFIKLFESLNCWQNGKLKYERMS